MEGYLRPTQSYLSSQLDGQRKVLSDRRNRPSWAERGSSEADRGPPSASQIDKALSQIDKGLTQAILSQIQPHKVGKAHVRSTHGPLSGPQTNEGIYQDNTGIPRADTGSSYASMGLLSQTRPSHVRKGPFQGDIELSGQHWALSCRPFQATH